MKEKGGTDESVKGGTWKKEKGAEKGEGVKRECEKAERW